MVHRRARSEEAKRLRREAILRAAAQLWERSTFDELLMGDVARGARIAKGTLYLYFPTKEALLLELLRVRLDRCLSEIEAALEGAPAPLDPDEAARLVATALLADEPLVRLLMVMGTILEHNVPDERIRELKLWLGARLAVTGSVLERRLPFLAKQGGMRLLLHVQALVSGLGQLTRPAPAVERVIAAPELVAFRLDFAEELRVALAALLRGFSAATSTQRSRTSPVPPSSRRRS